ncbi:hypothetical protein RZS08_46825, partial [Arthrospira platensis SPKY1]|nr:hypothetical protein [Arthrospira platensis SPKY1]
QQGVQPGEAPRQQGGGHGFLTINHVRPGKAEGRSEKSQQGNQAAVAGRERRSAERLAEKVLERFAPESQDQRNERQKQHGQGHDRRGFMGCGGGRGLARENREEQPEDVEAGEQGGQEAHGQ